MANRNKSYDEVLASKFENIKYAQGYLINIIESEGLALDESLRQTIKAMGLQQFSRKSNLSIQAVSDFVSKRQSWSTDKITRLIKKVFKLTTKISLTPLGKKDVA